MDDPLISIDEIQSTLDQLRQDPRTQRRFPRELWDSIIHLTKTYSIKEVCRQLHISPIYLKRKIHQSKKKTFEFQEIHIQTPPSSDIVMIELNSTAGLKAKIQGPISCLNCLCKLFRG